MFEAPELLTVAFLEGDAVKLLLLLLLPIHWIIGLSDN
jgi:hypothetical protein